MHEDMPASCFSMADLREAFEACTSIADDGGILPSSGLMVTATMIFS